MYMYMYIEDPLCSTSSMYMQHAMFNVQCRVVSLPRKSKANDPNVPSAK